MSVSVQIHSAEPDGTISISSVVVNLIEGNGELEEDNIEHINEVFEENKVTIRLCLDK